MYKRILFLLIITIPLTFVFSQQFFNPFQYGIKTVEKVKTINNEKFRNEVRKKAAQLLNEFYPTSTFKVQENENKIISETGQDVNEAVKNSYGDWEKLIKSATDLLLSDCDTLAGLGMIEYCHWKTVRVDIQNNVLTAIYIAPSGYGGPFPRVSPCEKGIGQCLLFFFDRALRILYFGALALGVIFLMWAGILYITKPSEAKNIHQRFIWGIVGIIVGITSFTIVIGLENWLAGGLTTEIPTGGGTSGEVVGTTEGGTINIRKIYIDRQKDALYLTFDVRPEENKNYCGITITGKDDLGNTYNIAHNLQLSEGTNIEKVFRNLEISATATELELTFSPEDPICTINPPSYIAKIGQYVAVSPTPKIIIDTGTAKIDENKKFSVFVSSEKTCDLTASFYNLTKGKNLGSSAPVSISGDQYFSFNLSNFEIDLGDTIRVIFKSSNCEVSVRQLDIRTKALVTTVPTIKKPIIDLNIRSIYGQQTININIEELKIKNILEQALGITVIQRNLYNPPFTMYTKYEVTQDNNPPQTSGNCTIYGRLRGIQVNQLSLDQTKALSYTAFNRDFSFNLKYEANRIGPYNIPIPLPLPNNIIGFINLELYHYTGDCEEVKVNDKNISLNPFNATYDIETGRFYSVSGNILRDLFGF